MDSTTQRALGERLRLLAENHVDDLSPREAEVIVLATMSLDGQEIASLLGIQEPTVANTLDAARDKVIPELLTRSQRSTSAWTFLHRGCCVATQWWQSTRLVSDGEKDLLA